MKHFKQAPVTIGALLVLAVFGLSAFHASPARGTSGRYTIRTVSESGGAAVIVCDSETGEIWVHRVTGGLAIKDMPWVALGNPTKE